jgi:hypothetical protein
MRARWARCIGRSRGARARAVFCRVIALDDRIYDLLETP